jgi:hypothetical protein
VRARGRRGTTQHCDTLGWPRNCTPVSRLAQTQSGAARPAGCPTGSQPVIKGVVQNYQWKTLNAKFVGKRFGDLVVLHRAANKGKHSAWLCHCDCGSEKVVAAGSLLRGFTLSCGCRKRRTLGKSFVVVPGQRFERLTAEVFVEYRNRHAYFIFLCDCGQRKLISANSVKRGDVKSCGCFRDEHTLRIAALSPGRDGKAPLRMLFKDYTTRAKQRRIEFFLSLEEFERIVLSNCAYCGAPPAPSCRKKYGWFSSVGIDRKDNSIGYTLENSEPCCMTCNTAKSTMTVEQFKQWAARLCKQLRITCDY